MIKIEYPNPLHLPSWCKTDFGLQVWWKSRKVILYRKLRAWGLQVSKKDWQSHASARAKPITHKRNGPWNLGMLQPWKIGKHSGCLHAPKRNQKVFNLKVNSKTFPLGEGRQISDVDVGPLNRKGCSSLSKTCPANSKVNGYLVFITDWLADLHHYKRKHHLYYFVMKYPQLAEKTAARTCKLFGVNKESLRWKVSITLENPVCGGNERFDFVSVQTIC